MDKFEDENLIEENVNTEEILNENDKKDIAENKEMLNEKTQENITQKEDIQENIVEDEDVTNENIQEIIVEDEKKLNENVQEDIKNTNSEESNTTNIVKDEVISTKKPHNKKFIVILAISIILVFVFLSTVFALVNSNSNTIISGISIKGIDVSGLTKEEAINKISEIVNNKISTPFDLVHNDYKTTVVAEQFGVTFDIESSVNTAYERGRGKNIFKSNFEIISSFFFKVNIIPSFYYNEETIDSLIKEIEANLPDRLIEPSYYIDGSNLMVTKGVNGVTIDSEVLKLKIISNIINFYNKNENIDIPTNMVNAKDIDIDAIHSEIYKEPKDAYYTKNPFTVYPHVEGVDFSNTIDEVKQMLQEDKENYVIPLKFSTPSVTTNNIGTEAFPDLLATYSTNYSTRNVNRTTNIKLASSKINGIVLMPGETFSYNITVGKRTAANGFKSAAVYAGGEVTTGIGGGICQVSSTLYNSVLLSNLEIVERHNHGFNTGYVPAGRDATVSWGGPDFRFKNNRKYPIKIICTNSGGTITTKIFGLKEENEYEVEIQSYITGYIQYKTITKEDPTLSKGATKVIANGSNGCKAVSYRILKQNGQVISKTLLANDTYNPHNKIVAVGTKSQAQ